MRVAAAGIGLRAGHVLPRLREAMPEARVVGVFDPEPTHLHLVGEDTPRYPSLGAMLSDARADLLFVGSPNAFHLERIRAGLLVFAEKPVVSGEEAMQLAGLLARHGPERVDVMEAGIAAPATDEARREGRIVDLRETWARLDAHGLRR